MPGRSLLRLKPVHKTVLACLVLALFLASFCAASGGSNDGSNHNWSDHDWKYEETRSAAREFVAGGMLHVRMTVGDLHIRRGDSDEIRLSYTVKSRREKNVKESRVDFEVRGNDATIEFHAPSDSNTSFDVELEVPANTNLDVHEKVGDLIVENVEGDKDLELDVGDIRVEREPAKYRMVRASAGIGDVNADVADDEHGEVSGWLGKTVRYHGDGKYELRAHVGVGDITLEGK